MGEVEQEKKARAGVKEVQEVITSKSASPKEGRQAGLPVPALCFVLQEGRQAVSLPLDLLCLLSVSMGLVSCYYRGDSSKLVDCRLVGLSTQPQPRDRDSKTFTEQK